MFTSIAAYRFVAIDDPAAVVARVRALAEELALLGTVLVADEGINLFLAGEAGDVQVFLARLGEDPRFHALEAKLSRSQTRPFARLKVKRKPEIISFRREGASPLDGRAPAVAPRDLARWIGQGHDDAGRRLVLLDTRNREEVGHGSFAGALTLPIDSFTALPGALEAHRDALADATVVGFCTGGIRCEKAVNWMRGAGYPHALQLEGGILGWFEAMGDFGYEGSCFVFDERIALDPALGAAADANGR
ncbi:rhodanese-like domain-containing protein [Luteimonas sp. MC1750]|uniref:oxygen-dependent tRNA uridine(34) hydroxylase TrhO n=1 Tax=Luteimonas sp. MC1750 TaxID=2799326 RepID=UPI0018F0FB2A|nr:rhodanese-like domain-containing protein [Luteimonas sp. MC1750]MBJ6984462.1 sulfurtransferase [Luteimonas sp. MC1750]QQO04924.1 sulfurtransferase [Luteimonas sp. MC1750]